MSQSTSVSGVGQLHRPAKPELVWAPIDGELPDAPTQAEVTNWLRVLTPPDMGIEMRALRDNPETGEPDPYLHRFTPSDLDFAVHLARKLAGQYNGVYFVLNGITPPHRSTSVRKGAKTADITRRFWILVDVDTTRAAGKESNSTDDEKAASWEVAETIRKALRARGWPEPIVCDSGNGWHLLIAVDLPNDQASTDLVKAVLIALAGQYNTAAAEVDLKVYDAPRITKFYGTLVRKGEPTPERPHRYARVLSIPDEIMAVEARQLAALAAEGKPAPKAEGTTGQPREGGKRAYGTVGRLSTEERAVLYLKKCADEGPAISGNDGHGQTFGVACRVGPGFDLDPATAFRLIREYYNPACQPPWNDWEIEHKVTDAYANETRRGWLRDADRNAEKAMGGRASLKLVTGDDQSDGEQTPPVVTDLPLTDLGNGERLVKLHGRDIRYVHPWKKWITWDRRRWKLDNTAAIGRFAKGTVRSIYREAAAEPDQHERKNLVRWARESESKSRIQAMKDLASAEQGVPALPEELDRHPWLLNCRNGTIDLQTGKLRPHDRADMLTKMAPVDFDPDAVCPLFMETLRTFLVTPELIAFWHRLCGMAITGIVDDHILPVCYGTGANGKSTLLGILIDTLGTDYAMKAMPDLLIAKKNDTHPTDRADLFGKRIVIAIETEEGQRLNETLVKELTGGDRIRARRMREDPWEFEPTHTVILATNHEPQVRGTDQGIWRRLKKIPFSVRMLDDQARKDMPRLLRAELPGILAWLVRGCLDWQTEGLNTPEIVTEATNEYRQNEDVLGAFVAECCFERPGEKEQAGPLYTRYQAWCEASGLGALGKVRFGKAIAERGYRREKDGNNFYHGLKLRPEPLRPPGQFGQFGSKSGMNGLSLAHEESTGETVQTVQTVRNWTREEICQNTKERDAARLEPVEMAREVDI